VGVTHICKAGGEAFNTGGKSKPNRIMPMNGIGRDSAMNVMVMVVARRKRRKRTA
jgi:hypothetical protein